MDLDSLSPEQLDTLKRRAVLVPCKSKDTLKNWVKLYLNLDLPDCIVDPSSNSCPMDILWLAYCKMVEGDPDYTRILFFAARDCFKSLLASVIELLSVLHLKRDNCHLAAIESQSRVCARYLRKYAVLPYIRDYVSQMSERRIEFTRFERSGETISFVEYNALNPVDKLTYTQVTNFIQVVIATMQGTNCVDGGTAICMSDGSFKLAKDVVAGDVVRGFDLANRSFIYSEIAQVSNTSKPSMRVTFDNGGQLVCSEDHPILTRYGWLRTRALHVGDLVLSDDIDVNLPIMSGFVPVSPLIHNPWSVVLGTLLGDSSLSWPTNKTKGKYGCGPRLTGGHSVAQECLVESYEKALEALGIPCRVHHTGPRTGIINRGEFVHISSGVSEKLAGLHRLLYGTGKKRVTEEVLSLVDLEALAYWIMDDGCSSTVQVGILKEHPITIATCGFSLEENNLIVRWLRDRWGLSSQVVDVTNSSHKRYHAVELTLASSRRLSEMLDPFFLPQLKYKLPVPWGMLDTRCIECGELILPHGVDHAFYRMGFTRCHRCHHPNLKAERTRQKSFVSRFTRKVAFLEFLGTRVVYDLEILTDNEQQKNFWVNTGRSSILLHNSAHSQVLLLDELDLAPRAPVEESKMIPTQCADGKPPVVLMTSSRKFAAGLVQEEIDEAEERGTRVFHWNLLDCTRPCPPDRHLPQSPMIDIYYSESNLKAISEVAYGELGEDQKEKYKKTTGYTGCLKNCRLFAVCRGRLVSGQKCRSTLLKTIPHVQNLFRSVDVEVAKAQLMCWKPSNYGLIYPNFDISLHVLSPSQMATKVTGDAYPGSFSKADLIRLFKSRDAQFFAGMDHGYTHNFAVVTGVKDGNRFFVLDVISAAELELSQKIEVCTSRIKDMNPVIYADPEDPASNKTLKKHFRMRDWSKKPGSVVGGISIVRYKLMPTMGNEPQLYFLAGDPDVDTLVKDFSKYRWMLDKNSGKPTDIPSEEDDDRMDALRYVVMNVFDKMGKLTAAPETAQEKHDLAAISGGGSLQQGNYSQTNWAAKIIQECLQPTSTPGQDDSNQSQSSKGKKGSFIWDLG